jgi:hypothetical protein
MSISSPPAPTNTELRAKPHRSVFTEANSLRDDNRCVVSLNPKPAVSSKCSSTASSKSRPWEGPLPQPRVSPKFWLGDAIEKAIVSRSSLPTAVGSHRYTAIRQLRSKEGVMVHVRSDISRVDNAHGNSKSKSELHLSWAAHVEVVSKRIIDTMGLYPSMPYQPVPGLVALFARAAPSFSRNPRAPHSLPHATTVFSYAAIIKSLMDSRKFNGGSRELTQDSKDHRRHKAMVRAHLSRVGAFSRATKGFTLGMLATDLTRGSIMVDMAVEEDLADGHRRTIRVSPRREARATVRQGILSMQQGGRRFRHDRQAWQCCHWGRARRRAVVLLVRLVH